MKRPSLYAMLAAGALVVAGCGSSQPGTPVPAPTSGVSTPAASTPPASMTPSTPEEPSGAPETGSPETGSPETGSPETGSPETGASDTGTPPDSESSDSSEPGVTVGNGGLDAQTANWFTVMCSGLAPLAKAGEAEPSADASDPKALQSSFVQLYSSLGDAMTNTANQLKTTPPPTFDQGPTLAGTMISGLSTAGPALKAAAQQVGAVNATDIATVQSAILAASSAMTSAMGSLSDIDKYHLDPKTEAAVDALPACKAIGFNTTG